MISDYCTAVFSFQISHSLGYKYLTLQIGRGEFTPENNEDGPLTQNFFRYKESIEEDIRQADLVISHAGKFQTSLCLYVIRIIP